VIKHLPNRHGALSSNPNTEYRKKEKETAIRELSIPPCFQSQDDL
jgi:hypothetical protein